MQTIREASLGRTDLTLVVADITTLEVDAIVNAANQRLAGGGGVDGAIHRAAGPELIAACRRIGGCPMGEARLTDAYRLPARYVIHAVGPVWSGGTRDEDALLGAAYSNSLDLAARNGVGSIAFPAISTGVYGFPADRAARIAVDTAAGWIEAREPDLGTLIFCCFSAESARHHEEAFDARGL